MRLRIMQKERITCQTGITPDGSGPSDIWKHFAHEVMQNVKMTLVHVLIAFQLADILPNRGTSRNGRRASLLS
jgi:hypothetical protein